MIKNFLKTSIGSKYFVFLIILQIISHNFIFLNFITKNTIYLLGLIFIFLFSIFYKDFHYEEVKISYKKNKSY